MGKALYILIIGLVIGVCLLWVVFSNTANGAVTDFREITPTRTPSTIQNSMIPKCYGQTALESEYIGKKSGA